MISKIYEAFHDRDRYEEAGTEDHNATLYLAHTNLI